MVIIAEEFGRNYGLAYHGFEDDLIKFLLYLIEGHLPWFLRQFHPMILSPVISIRIHQMSLLKLAYNEHAGHVTLYCHNYEVCY